MADHNVNRSGELHEGWTVRSSHVPWQFEIISQTLTAHPPRQSTLGNLSLSLALTIAPGDPQWDLFNLARLPRQPLQPLVSAQALALVLPRIHSAVTDPATRWQVATAPAGLPTVTGVVRDAVGAGTAVWLEATAAHPGHSLDRAAHQARQLLAAARSGPAEQAAAFSWMLAQVPGLPNMPTAATDWAERTAVFLAERDAALIGQITVRFTNAINGRSEQRVVADEQEARRLAREYRPFNNTRPSAHVVVAVRGGVPVVEELDLTGGTSVHPAPTGRAAGGGAADQDATQAGHAKPRSALAFGPIAVASSASASNHPTPADTTSPARRHGAAHR
ncbi:hypothetical protein ACFFX1_10195 [Dactylosporangium sucinum]|uniref:Uncharacterized protein n=1 Tax=Dactylosporangium sucinum TaxID=1424081 RepID=A0A917WRS2_9ACTN|nr:hypothetical protein [Dactylosporangium sucinum]GGM24084.1 hypothetical protein GCM10007977_026530 [Dactylosporangium sucinum]